MAVLKVTPMRSGWRNLVGLDVRALLQLVFDTAALRRLWSATVLKASRSSFTSTGRWKK